MKKRSQLLFACTLSALLLLFVPASSGAAMSGAEEHFSVKEYNEFHEVLHALQHEALPKKDFKTIRARAVELTTRGEAIVKLGVPAKVTDAAEFEKELKRFSEALAKYKSDAEAAEDAKLEESYLAVHDTFETLASMLPRKSKDEG
jgi:hypothetical protein